MRSFLLHIACITFLINNFLFGQVQKDFREAEMLMTQLQANQAELFFPDIISDLAGRIDQLKVQAENANWLVYDAEMKTLRDDLHNWVAVSEKVHQTFITLLSIRQQAVLLGAEDYAPNLFRQAETALLKAADAHRRSKISSASQRAAAARKLYQQATLTAIRNNLLGEVRVKIQEAEDFQATKTAPQTYARTQQLLAQVEEMVQLNRYDDHELPAKSTALDQSATQLLFLAKHLHPAHFDSGQGEALLLGLEKGLTQIAQQLDYQPRYGEGFSGVLQDIQVMLQSLQDETSRLSQRNMALETENQELERRLRRYQSLADQERFLQRKINRAMATLNSRIEKQGSFLTIYLDSLNWKQNEPALSPENQVRLLKLVEVLTEFPDQSVIIRYIQLAPENNAYFQTLAAQRAEIIRNFLQSRPLLQDKPIQAVGINSTDYLSLSGSSHLEVLVDLNSYLTLDKSSRENPPSSSGGKPAE